jgi:hypothetical protein
MSWVSEQWKRTEKAFKTNISNTPLRNVDLGTINYDQLKLNTDQDFSPFVKGAIVVAGTTIGAAEGFLITGGNPYGAYAGAAAGAEVAQNINKNAFGSRYDPSKDGGAIQKAITGTTGDIQRETVNTAKGIQNATIVNTSNLQKDAVDFADRNNLGRNETLEKWASEITGTGEEGAREATKIVEANAAGITSEAEKGAAMLTTAGENTADAFSDVYDLLTGKAPDEEGMGDLGADYGDGADLEPLDETSMDDPFNTIEDGTAKDDQMTEEEKMKRIRRLLLNRYGREDTILTGTADTANRRTYAL